mmetsp:Transcript_41690/g.69642  ORF Transcript_41690/g.69642 Transcript_41690/m.69642 type:complete len:173 (-) Transcript_41690:583-1101(-)|eukprot:CAMPEP_0198211484 /NCGR_PEP_ID=MMETSP1445-20131203/24113_1 /TAXON_ID=36898 /ORGANISM="Pyramimonas sp., Strain CCMP2087" /LENGTH=172 /DNA_ID=CAMNT_0043885753 /DNA_START=97 /DNA_END=615 /DNA_ORIENTATION=+
MALRTRLRVFVVCLLLVAISARTSEVLQQADSGAGASEIASQEEDVAEDVAEAAAVAKAESVETAESAAAPAKASSEKAKASTDVGRQLMTGFTDAVNSLLPGAETKQAEGESVYPLGGGDAAYHKKRLSMNAMTDVIVYMAMMVTSLALPVAACTYIYRTCCGPGSRKAID